MKTLKINYNQCFSELCTIGKKYDTDKSSQRDNANAHRHRHPYTLFYENLFRNKRDVSLTIAELGILYGGSLLMWEEYFKNAQIYGFELNQKLIDKFNSRYNSERITISNIDVKSKDSIINTFQSINMMYDIIIEDTTHVFEDQIRVIENVYSYIKPGGILIIEDISKSFDEKKYITQLAPILHHFQDYYFVELDHVNKVSTGWNNDKLFVLVKGGDEPIFKNSNKITIITPSYRTDNLEMVKNSIDFNYVDKWYIIYDGSKIKENPNLFTHPQIEEHVYEGPGISGNPQRNYALSLISDPNAMLYFLDDDNVIHPHLYHLLKVMDNTKMYTFNQDYMLRGCNISPGYIDTAMVLIPFSSCNTITWILDKYGADGHYIKKCYEQNIKSHIFVNNNLCHYNKLTNKHYHPK